jgi:hypothetical protein
MNRRVNRLVNRLRKGIDQTLGTLRSLSGAQWQMVLYEEPYPWMVRDMVGPPHLSRERTAACGKERRRRRSLPHAAGIRLRHL